MSDTPRPTLHRVIVKPTEINREIETKSGIKLYRPDQTVDMERAGNYEGYVVAVGPTAFADKDGNKIDEVKVGDRVIWPRYAGVFHPPGETAEYCILNDEDILAVFT